MDTLKDLIDALMIITQVALVLRYIILKIQAADMEDQQVTQYKKQQKKIIIALIMVACVYDVPRLLDSYFSGNIIYVMR